MFEKILDCLSDALKDAAWVLPILLIVYLLIEWVEYKNYAKVERSLLLQGKLSPLFGALLGSVPQCGFSVASTELFVKGSLSAGALVAVYIATSDEALPILLSHPERYTDLLLLVGIKIVLALLVGYPVLLFWKRKRVPEVHEDEDGSDGDDHHGSIGCCHHEIEGGSRFEWKHPVIHCLKIFAYILAINLILNLLIAFIGQEKLTEFLSKSVWIQPLLALPVGLIPNCASSVLLTELYLLDGIGLGAVVAGLTVNAGLGLMVLYKENKSLRENLTLTAIILSAGLIAGYAITLFGW